MFCKQLSLWNAGLFFDYGSEYEVDSSSDSESDLEIAQKRRSKQARAGQVQRKRKCLELKPSTSKCISSSEDSSETEDNAFVGTPAPGTDTPALATDTPASASDTPKTGSCT
ncbi:hypothetical protein QE152_g36060 [Popillia japonica]|uniref:Uncharacterized protein n=1 Tax=Popillia japonica TaxID=7064 RepID=A0AAW1IEE0_POPJA